MAEPRHGLPRLEMAHHQVDSSEGILTTVTALRGLKISEESSFNFDLPADCRVWPLEPYGTHSPHLLRAKANKAPQVKRNTLRASHGRHIKSRRPKGLPVAKRKLEPSKEHGPVPTRDPPLHLLTMPGELRDMIYDLLVLSDGPQHPQLRPVLKRDGRRLKKLICRHPQEPALAFVNKRLRHEVLSVFYGANRFIFRPSFDLRLEAYNMTKRSAMSLWKSASTRYLRHIELRLHASGRPGRSPMFSYILTKTQDGRVQITHSLDNTGHCHCLEDDAVADTISGWGGADDDLVRIALLLGNKRQARLSAVAQKDVHNNGMYRMPLGRCLCCYKFGFTQVSGD